MRSHKTCRKKKRKNKSSLFVRKMYGKEEKRGAKAKNRTTILLCSLVEESLLASTFVPLQSQCPELVPRPCPIKYNKNFEKRTYNKT